ncbi:MAG: hypothetical protein ACUVV1_06030 [Fimbriimonadales bacterium]
MQVSKPVALGIILVALLALGFSLWFTMRGGGSQPPEAVYPKSDPSQPGLDSLGVPEYTGSGPAEAPPIGSSGRR